MYNLVTNISIPFEWFLIDYWRVFEINILGHLILFICHWQKMKNLVLSTNERRVVKTKNHRYNVCIFKWGSSYCVVPPLVEVSIEESCKIKIILLGIISIGSFAPIICEFKSFEKVRTAPVHSFESLDFTSMRPLLWPSLEAVSRNRSLNVFTRSFRARPMWASGWFTWLMKILMYSRVL